MFILIYPFEKNTSMKKIALLVATALTPLLYSSTSAQTADPVSTTAKGKSEWVYTGKDGKLVYKTTPAGDKIMDFSHAGYMGGGVALPVVPVKITVQPVAGKDNTGAIQSAINKVAAMPVENGFRGAVLLAPGTFTCSGTITISTSGVVLRGSGSGKGGTTIAMTGGRHVAFAIGAGRSDQRPGESAYPATSAQPGAASSIISDSYVPSGADAFHVSDAAGFQVGDMIEIVRPVTAAWVHLMVMDNMVRDGRPETWIAKNRSLIMKRQITAINGDKFSVDAPLSDSYDAKYLNPPGTKVFKITPAERVEQSGVENIHVQCPPLESSYGEAPYSGIRVAADNCWVKDVYFEEMMNTTVLAGSHITMEKVVIKHTYTNLGASKPADFSFEGSLNLVDRCESTGGNTYIVWTSALIPGPNVVLNSIFRGHGSRLQPHQRWATGLLIDNCTIVDGGIDFMNRGVAGSGHGWSMGWGVAWNNIAKTYVIQNPPGAANWAIGNIGQRQQTARLFDTGPILAEGYFDSHGTPVAPQSLYLAQLTDRLGRQAINNIGYKANTESMFPNKHVQPLPPLLKEIDPVMGENLALHHPLSASNIRGTTKEFSGEKALDGDPKTYWATNDNVTHATLELDMENPVEINAVSLEEVMALGQRVQEYKVEGQVDSDWKLLAQGTTVGERKVDKFPTTTVWKVRITILKASAYPAIKEIGLYREKDPK
jgi:hypothetical protein